MREGFSALQRAENSSMPPRAKIHEPRVAFQCSSASRKFLNCDAGLPAPARRIGFSALQRAENSSMVSGSSRTSTLFTVSVLFSEPKIPQFDLENEFFTKETGFSALQRAENSSICILKRQPAFGVRFSALQRAENSSICHSLNAEPSPSAFQCSSASRKFLNTRRRNCRATA